MLLGMILLISPTIAYATKRFIEECNKASVAVESFDVEQLAARNFEVGVERYDALYVRQAYPYFAEVVALAGRFAAAGKRVVDANIIEGIGEGKAEVYRRLVAANVPIPETVLFANYKKSFPYILKWVYGFGGKQVHLVHDDAHVRSVLAQHPAKELLAQEFIKARYEYKVITIGYASIAVVLRLETTHDTFKPDFGKHQTVGREACVDVVTLAERAAQALGRELAKVDILEDFDGNLFVLEVNRWPGLHNFEDLTGYNVVKDFVQYVK